MVHGQWYLACFAENYANSSMWGHYANNHRGVCLKFSSGEDAEHRSLVLHRVIGERGKKGDPISKPVFGDAKVAFHKVAYQKTFPAIDFFRSLGRVSGGALAWWYSDENGNRSICARDFDADQDQWRKSRRPTVSWY
jgi:hypothetical protein